MHCIQTHMCVWVFRAQHQPYAQSFRLLMDYPFVKQVDGDYRAHVASLTGQHCERQISANTIRILLLEEQNTELREKNLPQTQPNDESQSYQVCGLH